MQKILIAGAGKIGSIIAQLLAETDDYHVYLTDISSEKLSVSNQPNIEIQTLNMLDCEKTIPFIRSHSIQAIVSCLPYALTIPVAEIAKEMHTHYFDLTEDLKASQRIRELAQGEKNAFVGQCGLAPGFINIVANDLMQQFDSLEEAKLRCGALPQSTSNALQYSLTWSTDGLINEYINPCQTIINGKKTTVAPLEDLETIQIDGLNYEAFNTSGGIGSLIDTYLGKINTLNYKSIRYPNHCEKMRFLIHGLKLKDDRDTLKRILENAIPGTKDDVVLIYVSIHGKQHQQFTKESYVKKFYPRVIHDTPCTAIQATTASGACAIIDIVLNQPDKYHGKIHQEDFSLTNFLQNRFGKYFAEKNKDKK